MYGALGRASARVPKRMTGHTITRFDFELNAPHQQGSPDQKNSYLIFTRRGLLVLGSHSQGLGAHYQPEAGAANLRVSYQRILGKGLMALHRHVASWGLKRYVVPLTFFERRPLLNINHRRLWSLGWSKKSI